MVRVVESRRAKVATFYIRNIKDSYNSFMSIFVHDSVDHEAATQTMEAAELLFREARRRQRRRRLIWAACFAFIVVMIAMGAYGEHQASLTSHSTHHIRAVPVVDRSIGLLGCTGKSVVEPKSFVISCADGNAMLTKTRWSAWTSSGAKGTTTFAINLCNPYCAASRTSFFPNSLVTVSGPVSTKHGVLFSSLVVTYRINHKLATFPMSWKGDPSF